VVMTAPQSSETVRSAIDSGGASAKRVSRALAILAPGGVYEIADLLEHLAEIWSNPALGNAARSVLGHVGRQTINDDAALAEMARVLDAGEAETVEGAARYAAASLPGCHSLNATTKRLARKYRKLQGTKY
jgi:hypothetical protein